MATAKKIAPKDVLKKAPAGKMTAKKTVKRLVKKPARKVAPKVPAGPPERVGVIEIAGKPATVIGNDVSVGMKAPTFIATASDWSPVDVLADSKGKVRIFAAVPSLDTATCDRETRRFNQEAAALDPNIIIYTISTDFPFRQKAWCGNAGIDRVVTVSDVVNTDFGVKYGVLLKERRYLRRSVFIVDKNDTLSYVAYMPQLGVEPNYDEVIAAAKAALAA